MGELIDKTKAAGNKVAGATKDAVGKATDNKKLQAEGKAQKAKGAVPVSYTHLTLPTIYSV